MAEINVVGHARFEQNCWRLRRTAEQGKRVRAARKQVVPADRARMGQGDRCFTLAPGQTLTLHGRSISQTSGHVRKEKWARAMHNSGIQGANMFESI